MRLFILAGCLFFAAAAYSGDTTYNSNKLRGYKKLFYKLVILHPKINSSFERTLLRHYIAGSGETYLISETDFKKLKNVIPGYQKNDCILLKANPELCAVKVDLLQDAYFGWALGTVTCIFSSPGTELISFFDIYDFNKKKKGERPLKFEIITRIFKLTTPRSAKPFVVSYADAAYSVVPL
jgi:hypothetical protein